MAQRSKLSLRPTIILALAITLLIPKTVLTQRAGARGNQNTNYPPPPDQGNNVNYPPPPTEKKYQQEQGSDLNTDYPSDNQKKKRRRKKHKKKKKEAQEIHIPNQGGCTCTSKYQAGGQYLGCRGCYSGCFKARASYNSNLFYCRRCHSSCRTCKNSRTCDTCRGQHYLDSASRLCYRCGRGCERCRDAESCDECLPGFFLPYNGAQCSKCLVENCAYCKAPGTTCNTCSKGFFADDGGSKCTQCMPHCGDCTSATDCKSCHLFYKWDGDKRECVQISGKEFFFLALFIVFAVGVAIYCLFIVFACETDNKKKGSYTTRQELTKIREKALRVARGQQNSKKAAGGQQKSKAAQQKVKDVWEAVNAGRADEVYERVNSKGKSQADSGDDESSDDSSDEPQQVVHDVVGDEHLIGTDGRIF